MSASDDKPNRRTGRSVLAIVTGFLATAVLSLGTDVILHAAGVYPAWGLTMSDGLFAVATAYRIAFTIVGGFLAARLAPSRPMKHVWILAGIGTFFAIVGAAATWNKPELGPRWYPLALVITALPCVWAGGKLHRPA